MKRLRIMMVIAVIACTLLGQLSVVFADIDQTSGSDEITITANEEQLVLLNELDLENMTVDEVFIRVFPNEYKNVSKSIKKQFKMIKMFPKESEYEKDYLASTRSSTYGSNISISNGVLTSSSYNNYGSPEQWVYSAIVDDDTKDIYEFNYKETSTYKTYFSVSCSEMPPTGNYYTWGRHRWKYYDTYTNDYEWLEYALVSMTLPISYVNQ